MMTRHIKDTTTVLAGTRVILAPGEVRPGHMMFAPLSTNLMAPLSTCIGGSRNGSTTHIKQFIKYMLLHQIAYYTQIYGFSQGVVQESF